MCRTKLPFLIALLFLFTCQNVLSFELYLVRHFEKMNEKNDPELTREGQIRAESLAKMLGQTSIEKVYSTNYNRTKQSAMPTSEAKGLPVQIYNPRELESFAKTLLARKESALVLGHSNTTPALIDLLGGKAKKIDESDYGELFILHIEAESVSQSSIMVIIP